MTEDNIASIAIRAVRSGDLEGILGLARRTGVFTSEEVAVVKELVEAELNDPQQREYRSLLAEADGHVVGFVCYGPAPMTEGTYDLYWIFVHPSYQRHAIGRLLTVDTSSTEPYSAARRFYQRRGFGQVAEVRDYYRVGDSRLTYVKLLSTQQQSAQRGGGVARPPCPCKR
jgi:ribosomal protein S18 acetylase RimI-like enzyme